MHLEKTLAKFKEIVSPNFCNELARRSRFVQRSSSQLQGYEFAQAMVTPNAFLGAETLDSLVVRMRKINKRCNLSASALSQRMNTQGAQEFMKGCFAKVLKEIVKQDFDCNTDLPSLGGFNRILIEDSTQIELHERLSPYFKGSGGLASKASIKIDYIFDYHSEQIESIDFCSGNKPDQCLSEHIIPLLQKDDLVLRDLGYFVIRNLKEIEEKGAYYISRWKVNEVVYETKESENPLDLATFLEEHMWNGMFDKIVFIGKTRYPVRMVGSFLDEEGIQKRQRGAKKSSVRRGTQMSKKKISLLKFNIFITNIPGEILSSISVMSVYRARWRVEMIFKQWKSCLKLHLFKGCNSESFHCYLYSRLIMCLLLGAIYPILMRKAHEMGRELSNYKLINYLIADHKFARALEEDNLEELAEQLLVDMPRRLCMDKRKRKSLRNNIRKHEYSYDYLITSNLGLCVA